MHNSRLALIAHSRLAALAVSALIYVCVYWGTTAHPWREPAVLSPGWLDDHIPVWQPAIWFYLAEIPLVILAILRPAGIARVQAVLAMALACVAVGTVFLVHPTVIPRLASVPDGITGFLWQALYAIDTPYGASPSLHAAFAVTSTAALWHMGLPWRVTSVIVSMLAMLAALAIRQHYIVDLAYGLCVGVLAQLLARYGVRI